MNVVGYVRNASYQGADGQTAYVLAFTCDELDFLDSRAEAEARRARQEFVAEMDAPEADSQAVR